MAETNKAITTIANAVKQKQWDAPHPTDIAELLGRKFGNAAGFVDMWFEQLEDACLTQRGKKTTLDAFKGMFEIFKSAYEGRDKGPEATELNAEQIELELRACCLRMLSSDKDLFGSIALELGYELVPADSDKLIKMELDKQQ